ncbi:MULTISPECIES: DUF4232 domain-containing protein [unclassified Streptomyces]|uniref:DUF4232 domain-containing protein n=1 Tax=unclassified Streptomyces TaxID=2593676 RepID=UPI0033A75262
MRVHKLTFAALAVAAGLSLTACQNGDDGSGQSAPSAASGAKSPGGGSSSNGSDQAGGSTSGGSDQSGGTGGAGKGTSAGTGSSGSGKVERCHTDGLEITAKDNTISGDPDGTVAVQLKNRGSRDCAISGYAGVDLKTASGTVSAKRTGQRADQAILKSGQSTAFGVTYPLNKSGGSGVRITGLLVTPPNETKTVTLAWPGAASLPVTDGSGAPVKVGPVGSAGQGG